MSVYERKKKTIQKKNRRKNGTNKQKTTAIQASLRPLVPRARVLVLYVFIFFSCASLVPPESLISFHLFTLAPSITTDIETFRLRALFLMAPPPPPACPPPVIQGEGALASSGLSNADR